MRTTSNFIQRRIIQGPKLVWSIPANGAVGVDPAATITMQFNKPMSLSNVALERSSIPALVGRAVSHPGGDLTKLLVTPTVAMAAGEVYRIYERIGFPLMDTTGKARYDNQVPFPFSFTIA